MLKFKMTSDTAHGATAGSVPASYKTVPNHSTLAMTSGMDRLLSAPASSRTLSRESSGSSTSDSTQEWGISTAEKRRKARASAAVCRELDEYLEDPPETFSRTEQVDGIERRVVFDLLVFWQVCVSSPISCL
jgi:hypothetical protein